MAHSLKRLHTVALAGVLACLLLAAGMGYLFVVNLQGSWSILGILYLIVIIAAIGGVVMINIKIYRTIGAVRSDIRSLVQMFKDVHQGMVRLDYPVVFKEFAVAQRYLHGWGRELLAERERLKDMGLMDHLSQLSNRRHFEMRLKEVFENLPTHGPSSVLIIDADRFKQVNDVHGHDAGDALITKLAAALRNNVRYTDILARLGGDEFCIIYTYVPLAKAKEFAERLRRDLPKQIEIKPGIYHELRWTGGLSAFHDSDMKPDNALHRADQALLRAKEAGRNHTAIADPVSDPKESVPSANH
jgi:diguanylate cyclase (GGDEF)-like protein